MRILPTLAISAAILGLATNPSWARKAGEGSGMLPPPGSLNAGGDAASPRQVKKTKHDTVKNSINNVRKSGKPGNDPVERAKVTIPDLKRDAGSKSKPKFNDFQITHTYDKASPALAKKPNTPLLTSPGLLDASGGSSSTGPAAVGAAAPRPAAPAGPVFR